MSVYSQSRSCAKCGFTEKREVSTEIAAFEERRDWTSPCPKCESTKFSSSSSELPEMNRQLFETWIHNPDLNVMSQDEDLIIGVGANLDLLEEFLLREDAASGKREMLLSAICVVLFDNIFDPSDPNDESDTQFAAKAETILRRNIALFDLLNENVISEYIKEVVYPVIGRELLAKP